MLDLDPTDSHHDSHHHASMRKAYILDSFKVNKSINSYKQWHNSNIESFIKSDIVKYNTTTNEVSKLTATYSQYVTDNESLTNSIVIPSFKFSYQSLKKLDDPKLLARIDHHEDDDMIDINYLFSVSDKNLPFPHYEVIEKLVSNEFALRMEKRLKYELCQAVKHQIVQNNSKWNNRATTIDDFLSKKLSAIIDDVAGGMDELETIRPESDDEDDDIEQELELELDRESEDRELEDQDDADHDDTDIDSGRADADADDIDIDIDQEQEQEHDEDDDAMNDIQNHNDDDHLHNQSPHSETYNENPTNESNDSDHEMHH
jgi:hypothetical protein